MGRLVHREAFPEPKVANLCGRSSAEHDLHRAALADPLGGVHVIMQVFTLPLLVLALVKVEGHHSDVAEDRPPTSRTRSQTSQQGGSLDVQILGEEAAMDPLPT